MTDLQERELVDKALNGMCKYLELTGWILSEQTKTLFYWIDPITNLPHRTDFAFLIASERYLSKNLNKISK